MCGIAGLVDPSSVDLERSLLGMLGCLMHRGPDGEGKFVSDEYPVAIGMRRLSIIDLKGGWQPLWNEDETICVVCNGEIYNYIELTQELQSKGHRFRTKSDCEVIVHLYEEHGPKLLNYLRGMFAFCVLDRRSGRLFLARDHFGQKPLYFAETQGRFAFASELKSLLVLPWVNRDIDEDAFLDFAAWLSLPAPRTHFKHIKKLPPGHSLTIELGCVRAEPKRYWEYDLGCVADLSDAGRAVSALDNALSESASLHVRADVPVGVLLSSGLDSRTVLAYARKSLGSEVHTFSVGFGAADSELVGAAATAQELQATHHPLELTVEDFTQSLDRVVWLLDEPIGDPACFAVLKLCELAREHVKVLLSGEGADELFAGYEGRYNGMLASMDKTSSLRWMSGILPRARRHASASRWHRFLARAQSSPASEAVTLRIEGLPGDVSSPVGLSEEQLAELLERTHVLAKHAFSPQRDMLSSLLSLDLGWQLAESLLQKADKMSMGASIELRTPILDIEVARVAARIPSSLKLPVGGPGKYILRKTLEHKLGIAGTNPKKGFPVPLQQWFSGPLRQRIEEELFAQNSFVTGALNRELLQQAWERFLAGADLSRVFFSLWMYERWRHAVSDTGRLAARTEHTTTC